MAEALNIRDAYVLTKVIKAGLPDDSGEADAGFTWKKLAPRVDYTKRRIRLELHKYVAFGAGQYKAPNAAFPIAMVKTQVTEMWISAVDLAEQVHLTESDIYESEGGLVPADQLSDIAAQGRWLLRRNQRTEELMRRDVVWNQLNITFPNGATIGPLATYGPYAATHIVNNAISWATVATATPLNDVRTWRRLIKRDSDQPAYWMHINDTWWHNLRTTTQMRNLIPNLPKAGSVLPTMGEIADLMGLKGIVVYDGGWARESDGVFVDMMRNGWIVLTSDYTVAGEKILETGYFPVLRPIGGRNRMIGADEADMFIVDDLINSQTYLRCHTARMAWINRPDCIVLANVNAGA
jgi:hypothetical protein